MRRIAALAACVALLLGSARALPRHVAPDTPPAETRALGALAREARTTLAAAVWLRVDYYYHTSRGADVYAKEILPLLHLVVALDPAFVRAIALLAFELEIHAGRGEEARTALERGLRANAADPLVSDLHGGLGMLHLRAGRTAEALLHLSRAAETVTEACDVDDLFVHLSAYEKLALRSGAPVPESVARPLAFLREKGKKEARDAGAGGEGTSCAASCLHDHHDLDEEHVEGEVQPWEAPRLAAALRARAAALLSLAFLLFPVPLLRRGS